MLSLKPEEIRFWEQVFLTQLQEGGDWEKNANNADYAVELRRERLKQPEKAKSPYRITDA